MANKYWVSGTGSWSDTTHWSASSGGAGGASVPTATDNVIFDAGSASDNYTVTITATANCADFTMDKPTGVGKKVTWAGSSALTISGSLNLVGGTAGITMTYSGIITFNATSGTKTFDFNSVVCTGSIIFDGAGGTFQLSRDTTISRNLATSLTLTNGTFDSNGKRITLSGNASGFVGNFTGSNSLYALTKTGSTNLSCAMTLAGNITITNNLVITGNSATARILVLSSVIGTPRTITITGTTGNSFSNVDFKDISLLDATPVVVDSYSESNQDDDVYGYPLFGQSFTGDGGILNSAKLYLRKYSGSVAGNISVSIYAHSGTFGTNSVPTGATLATSANIDAASLSTSYGLINFVFAGINKITLENGTRYELVVDLSGVTGDYVFIGSDSSSSSHAGNISNFDPDTWANDFPGDICFYVYKDTKVDLSAITGLSGDCGGNDGITFTTSDTMYFKLASGNANWSAVANWYLATNGGGGAGRVPLPQDDVVLDANSFGAASMVLTQDMPRAGRSITWAGDGAGAVANTPTWTTSTAASIFGSLTLVSGMVLTASTQTYTFEGRGNYTLTSAGLSFAKIIQLNAVGGSLIFGDDYNSAEDLYTANGTFDAATNNVDVSIMAFTQSAGGAAGVLMGDGTWTMNGAHSNYAFYLGSGIATFDCGHSTLKIIDNTNNDINFRGREGDTFYNVWFSRGASTGSNIIYRTTTFNDLKDDGSAAHSLIINEGKTCTVSTFTVSGTAGNLITINSSTTGVHYLTKTGGGSIVRDYLNIQHSVASPANTWYAFNSTNNQATATAGSGWNFGDFIIADSSSTSSAENIVLVFNGGTFVIADSGSASSAENISLIFNGTFTIADAVSSSSAENIVLVQAGGTLAMADSVSASSAENIALIFQGTFTIADASSASSAENVVLVRNGGDFVIADSGSTSSAENIVLIFNGGTFVIDNADSTSSAENINLIFNGTFTIADSVSSSIAEEIVLVQSGGTLAMADAVSSSSAENITLIFNGTFEMADASSASSAEEITLVQASGAFVVADAVSSSSAEEITLSEIGVFVIDDLTSASSAENIVIVLGGGTLTIADVNSTSSIENITIIFQGTFEMADAASSSSAENITLVLAGGTFAMADASSDSSAENIGLIFQGTFAIDDLISSSEIDTITLEIAGGDFTVADVLSSSSAENIALVLTGGNLIIADATSQSSAENIVMEFVWPTLPDEYKVIVLVDTGEIAIWLNKNCYIHAPPH